MAVEQLKQRICVTLPRVAVEWVDSAARDYGMNRSEYVLDLIMRDRDRRYDELSKRLGEAK